MSAARRGTVYLAGAGPGDAQLVTERALRLLRSADVVAVDLLVARELRDEVRPGARIVEVDALDAAQRDAACDLIVQEALAGRSVVRLKAGDPYLLGRGGEEALRCRAAKVPFEVVNGIPSAVAACAAAGIPLAHRGLARSVTIASALDDTFDESWRAAGSGTLVIELLPSLVGDVAAFLVDGGLAPSRPCAVIAAGATNRQRVVTGMLGTIASVDQRSGSGGVGSEPVVLAVGEVVELREHLAWLERRPLHGTRIAVTRPQAQSGELTDLLRELGAVVAQVPSIRVERLDDAALDAGIDSLREVQTVVFTSRSGVDAAFERLAERGLDARAFGDVQRLACVGEATAAALAERGLVADVVPAPGARTALGLLQALLELPLFGTRCTIFRAQVGDERLVTGLRNVNVDVLLVPAYRTVAEPATSELVDELLACDAVTFTSASTVASTVAMVGDASRLPPCVTLGAPTTQAALDAGVRVLQQADDQSVAAIVQAVVERALDNEGVSPWRHAAASAPSVPAGS